MRRVFVPSTRLWLAATALIGPLLVLLPGSGGLVRGASASELPAPQAATTVPDVIVVGAPALSWVDVDDSRTPNLWRLASSSALGESASARTRG